MFIVLYLGRYLDIIKTVLYLALIIRKFIAFYGLL